MSKRTKYQKERYHGPRITNGVHWSYVKVLSWISSFLSGVLYWGTTFIDSIGFFKVLFISCASIGVFSILFSILNSAMRMFRVFSYVLVALNVLILIIAFGFFGTVLFVANDSIYSPLAVVFMITLIVILLMFIGMYAWYYLPQNQGKVWAFNKVNSSSRKKNKLNDFPIILGCVFLAPFILTGRIRNAFGIVLAFSLTVILSSLVVDALYAAYYVRKHPESEEFY